MNWAEFERAGWEAHVDPYHHFFGPISADVAPTLLKAVGASPGTRLLDVCCGPGYLCGLAATRGVTATGVDIAENMISLAARLHPDATFAAGDACALPWRGESFEAVVCNFGIHHLPDSTVGLSEFGRVLCPGGRFAYSVWDEERSALAIVPNAVYGSGVVIPDRIPAPPPAPDLGSADTARPLLDAVGLRLTDVRTVSLEQHYPTADALWEGWLAAAIRTKPILDAQSEIVRQHARRSYDDAVLAYTGPGGSVTMPIVVRVVTGERPLSTARREHS